MKYLCNEVPWGNIRAVGFDMDGTLYDEFDFIYQAYNLIAKVFSNMDYDANEIMKIMLLRWLEKGSSYPLIFSEIATKVGLESNLHEEKINEALLIFRNFMPTIFLSKRIELLLKELRKTHELFLVSDGSSLLQWNKIKALNLENYFKKQNIFISGDHGKGTEKPSLTSLHHLAIFNKNLKSNEVVFIGDRIIDENYAKKAGFYFVNINSIFNKK